MESLSVTKLQDILTEYLSDMILTLLNICMHMKTFQYNYVYTCSVYVLPCVCMGTTSMDSPHQPSPKEKDIGVHQKLGFFGPFSSLLSSSGFWPPMHRHLEKRRCHKHRDSRTECWVYWKFTGCSNRLDYNIRYIYIYICTCKIMKVMDLMLGIDIGSQISESG